MDLQKIFRGVFGSKKQPQPKTSLPPPKPPKETQSEKPVIPKAPQRVSPSELEKHTQTEFEKPVVDTPQTKKSALDTPSGKATLHAVQELLKEADSQKHAVENKIQDYQQEQHKAEPSGPEPFHLYQGGELRTVDDLLEAAKNMSQEVFSHHVHESTNHFADWIQNTLNQPETAQRVRQATSQDELVSLLSDDAEPLPNITNQEESEEAPVEDLGELRKHFVHLRDEINSEIDESISLLHVQGERITSLREEVKASSEDLATREAQLRNELERLRTEQAGLKEEINHLKDKNEKLVEERKDAQAVQQEVRQIREQLRTKHEELLSARRLLKEQLQNRGMVEAQEELLQEEKDHPKPGKYHPSSEHLQALIQTIKEDIQANRWNAARHGYNDVRTAFYKAKTLEADERHELHQEIMDIYTQIHLHDMN